MTSRAPSQKTYRISDIVSTELQSGGKRRAEHFLRMIGALQRSSQEEFGSSHPIRRGPRSIVSSALLDSLEDPVVFPSVTVWTARPAMQQGLNLRHCRARGLFPCGDQLRRLHKFIPQNVMHVRLDQYIRHAAPRDRKSTRLNSS